MREAAYYLVLENNTVKCTLCPNYCIITSGQSGPCQSRMNIDGRLYAKSYARTISFSLDPMEKKPLYHYHPGSRILSMGANSCNLHCSFCQNYEISQYQSTTQEIQPDELLRIMKDQGLSQIAFTYTEPFTWFEYILDCGKLFKSQNIKLVLVTNGYINPEPLQEILPYIDAMNIDLKSLNPSFYSDVCKGKLEPVTDTIRAAFHACHIELTNLLIPELNDGEEDIEHLVDFVASISKDIPLHFSRYYPRWKCNQPETSLSTLNKAYQIATKQLKYVYLGNIQPGDYSNTYCPTCAQLLVERSHSKVILSGIQAGKCTYCGSMINGRY